MKELCQFANAAELKRHYKAVRARTKAWAPPPEPEIPQRRIAALPDPKPIAEQPTPAPPSAPAPPPALPGVPLSMRAIIRAVAAEFETSAKLICSQSRERGNIVPRQTVALLAREFTRLSLPQIGKALGGRDHTTIIHSIGAMMVRIENDGELALKVDRLRRQFKRKELGIMEVKCLELRDEGTFIPVLCIRPVPENEEQRYLLRRDGYRGDQTETCIIMIDAQCRGVAYDPYDWVKDRRTKGHAHIHIQQHWSELKDGDVVDVQFILGETTEPKKSERFGNALEDAVERGG